MSSWTVCTPWTAWTKLHQASVRRLPIPQPQLSWVIELWPTTHEPGNQLSTLTNYPTTPPVIPLLSLVYSFLSKKAWPGISLAALWLRLQTSNARGTSSIPVWEHKSHMLHCAAKKKKKSLTLGWEVLAYSKSLLTILVHWLRDDHYLRGKDGEEASLFKVRFGRGKNICMYNMWKLICIYHIYFTHTYA